MNKICIEINIPKCPECGRSFKPSGSVGYRCNYCDVYIDASIFRLYNGEKLRYKIDRIIEKRKEFKKGLENNE